MSSRGSSRDVASWGAGRLSAEAEAEFVAGVDFCDRFLMGEAEAQHALSRLTAILEEEGLPYSIIGAFALNEYGHRRVTVDVDLVMREAHLQAFKQRHLGKGYEERVPDVQELIRSAGLPVGVADELHPWVREKFLELWRLAQVVDPF